MSHVTCDAPQELTSDDIATARCSPVGSHDSAMGDCSSSSMLLLAWQAVACLLLLLLVSLLQ